MTDLDSVQVRLENLEAKFAFQERLLEELSGLVREQADTISLLVSQFRVLSQELKEAATIDSKPVKPPHY